MKNFLRRRFSKRLWQTVEDYWQTAFPPEKNMQAHFEIKKEEYLKKKELEESFYSDEDIEAMEKNIPKWKKGQLVFVKKEEDISEKSRFDKIKKFVSSYIPKIREKNQEEEDDPELKKALDEMEKEYEEFRQGFETIKDKSMNVAEKNMIYTKSKEAINKLKENLNNEVSTYMRKHYPDFDFDLFEKEIHYIFEEVYSNYLNHDVKKLELVCISEGLGFFKSLIQEQVTNNKVHKYKRIFNLHPPVLESSIMINGTPLFIFSIRFHELFCLVDKNNPEIVLDGSDSRKTLNDYLIYVMHHPDPQPHKTGHEWAIIKVIERNKIKALM